MNLVTVCNLDFFSYADRLVRSHKKIYPEAAALVCVFGPGCESIKIPNAAVLPIEQTVEHSWDPNLYWFKVAALKMAWNFFDDSFIYLDSRHVMLDRPVEIEDAVEKRGRFYVRYPELEPYRLKYLTTKECIRRVCGAACFDYGREMYSYWAAIQAYAVNEESRNFIDSFLSLMDDPLVAGPSNMKQSPDGPSGDCKHHRNDQSVLSLMLGDFQPFDVRVSSKYGDIDTIRILGGIECHSGDMRIRGRC